MILFLAKTSLARRRLATALTTLSVALGVMLVVTVLLLRAELSQRFAEPGRGYGLVVGPPGSRLSLVLSAVYHVEPSPGLVPFSVYRELAAHPSTRLSVPLAVGDSFRGFPVVGTTDAFFSSHMPYPRGDSAQAKLAEGRPFHFDPAELEEVFSRLHADDHADEDRAGGDHAHAEHAHDGGSGGAHAPADADRADADHADDGHSDQDHADEDHSDGAHARAEPAEADRADANHADDDQARAHDNRHQDKAAQSSHEATFEAVIGSQVARKLGVRVGDRIEPTHGAEGAAHAHERLWTVVGVLHPTGTAVDRLVLINLDSFYRIDEHAKGGLLPGTEEPAISAVLTFPKGGMHKALLLTRLRKRSDLGVAEVDGEIRKLMGIVGDVNAMLLLMAVLVTCVGLASILVSIYTTMSERQREFAILRAIGVRRATVMLTVVAEAAAVAVAGAIFGVALAHVLVALTAESVESLAGFQPNALRPILAEAWVLGGVTLGGALAGLLPAWKAYRTEVAESLAPAG